jgi:dynamin 1-like protein
MKEVTYKIRECEDRTRELGPSAPVDGKSKTQLLWNMITDFCETYKNTIRGKYDRRRNTK